MIGYYIEIGTTKDDTIIAQSTIFKTIGQALFFAKLFDYCNTDQDFGIYLMQIDTEGDCQQLQIIK